MNKINVSNQYQRLIDKYRDENHLSFQGFADAINACLPPKHGFTKDHWYAVYRETYSPNFYAMWYLAEHGHGWTREFGTGMAALLGGE